MSLIRSIEAKFIAQARGLKSTIQGVKKDIGGLEKKTKTFSNKMNDDFRRGSRSAATHLEKFALGTQKNFETIGNVLNTTSNKFGEWSRDIKSFGKTTSKALSPLTAFYATAAITGGKRMIANEQLDILMRNVFRTEKAYESAWDSVKGLTKGTAFMNSDVGQWLSQLVQSNIELGKSEDIMKSILDFSVGSGQIGIEGEIHDIIMKAIRSGGWDQMTLDMLAQRGLNLAGHIANVLGITTESAQDMLKDGSISMEESLDYFVDAVQVGSEGAGGYFASMADSAKEGGETMTGAWINVKAALAQLGEDMWKSGAWDQLKTALNNITDFLYELSPALEPMAKIIASIMATMVEWVQKLMTAFINLRPKTQALIASLSVIGAVLGPAIYLFGSFVGAVGKALKPLGSFFLAISRGLKFVIGNGGLIGAIKTLAGRFSFLLGPVGIAIGIITTLATIFTVAYKKSETFRNFIDQLGEKLKEVFFGIIDWIRPGFDAILSFFGEIKLKISEFINQEGTQLTDAFKSIGTVIGTVAKAIWSAIKWSFEQIKWIIADYVMPAVEFVIKQIWGNIKGIITGTLDVIMGAVKIFSGLFTGDFSKMWEGVKQLFLGAIKVIWNWIQLQFIGRILKGIGVFVKSFGSHITKLWSGAKTNFSNGIKIIWEWMKNSFIGRIITAIINFAKNFRTNLSKMWTLVKSLFKQRIAEIRESVANSFVGRIIKNIINFAKNFRTHLSKMWTKVKSLFTKRISEIYQSVKNSFVGRIISNIINFAKNFRTNISKMWTSVKSIFSKWIGNIRNSIANSFVGRMLSSVRNLKTNFVKIAKEMWQGVKRQFGNIVDGAKALPGRIGKGISGAKSKAVNAMKGVGNNLIRWAGKPYNKVVDGVNWITSKLGISKNIDPWPIPQYAKGTKGAHPGGPALVNDGRNRLSGEELIVLPDGSTGMFEGKDVVANLPEGTHVFSAPDTQDMLNDVPQYAKGTDSTQGFLDKGSNMVGGSAKKRTWKDKVWDYIKKPSKLLDIALDKFGAKLPKNTAMFKDMLKGGFNTIKDAALDKVKSTFKKQEKTEHNPNYFPSGGMLLGASGGSRSVSNPWGVHDYLYNIAKHIMRSPLGRGLIITSGYRSTSNTDHGKRNAIDLSGFGRNGGYGAVARWASRLPRVSYTIGDNVVYGRKYGDGGRPSWARGHMNHLHVSGYEDGGIINTKQLAWIAEGGWAESIISHDPAKYNSQKAIWQKTGDALGFTDDKGNKEILAKLERIAKAVEQEKDFVVNMDSKQVGEIVEQHVTHKQTRRSRRKRRASN